MSRFNPHHNVAPILDAATQWIQRCLIDERSLFTNKQLWTAALLEEVRTAFVDHPDESDAKFFDKLEGQMRSASADAKHLMAELLWALMLFPSNIRAVTKRDSIALVWGWSGGSLDKSHPLLADAVLTGVGSPGTAYNTMRWRELSYLIGLSLDLIARPRDERIAIFANRDHFEHWLAAAPQEGNRQFRHIFRYLAFPDFNERITQNRDRRIILEAYTDADPAAIYAMSDAEQDDALFALRKKLEAEHGTADLDFYAAPLVDHWRQDKDPPQATDKERAVFDTGYAVLRERFLAHFLGFESFATDSRYQKAERQYKDEMVELFNQTVRPAIESDDWASAGEAAIALLSRPLKSDGNRPQNIVGWRYVDLVRHLDAEKRTALGRALADLFDDSKAVSLRVDQFVIQLSEVVGEARPIPPAAQRSITGFYLALWDPHHHIFLKTQEMQRALRQVDPTFQWTSSQLTGADVERVDALVGELYSRLLLEDWDPEDCLDVQSFLWVATTSGITEVEEENEEAESVESLSESPRGTHRPPLNQILFGPPGTGKTFATINKALEILDPALLASCDPAKDRARLKARFDELIKSKRIRFVTFHQSFSYEDFVEGLRADTGDVGQLQYRVEPGVFKAICDDARGAAQVASEEGIRDGARILSKQQRQPLDHVLIIDEINRGNVSRVFGELITLIEPTKRAGAEEHLQVTLPYSKRHFDVPKNVYLIGTMNTADRSLAGMDIALRRRFHFVEMAPKPELLENIVVAGVNIGEMLKAMNRRIEVLLDRDHQLGHAWFIGLSSGPDLAPLENVFRHEILPLLQEYFFEDWQRIHWVLNDHVKPAGCRFVDSHEMDVETLFGNQMDELTAQRLWQVNDQALSNPECYRLIINDAKA